MNSELFSKVLLKPASAVPRERGMPIDNFNFPNVDELRKKFGPTIEADEVPQIIENQQAYYKKNPDERKKLLNTVNTEKPAPVAPAPVAPAPDPQSEPKTPWQAWQDQTDEESIAAQQNELLAKSRAQSQFTDLNRDQSDFYNQDSTSTHHDPVIWGPDQELVDGEWFDQAPKEFWGQVPDGNGGFRLQSMPTPEEKNRINADPEAMGQFWGRNYYWPWQEQASLHPGDSLPWHWFAGQDDPDPRARIDHTFDGGSYWSNRNTEDPAVANAKEKLNRLLKYKAPAHESLIKDQQLHNDHATFKKWLSNNLPEDYKEDYLSGKWSPEVTDWNHLDKYKAAIDEAQWYRNGMMPAFGNTYGDFHNNIKPGQNPFESGNLYGAKKNIGVWPRVWKPFTRSAGEVFTNTGDAVKNLTQATWKPRFLIDPQGNIQLRNKWDHLGAAGSSSLDAVINGLDVAVVGGPLTQVAKTGLKQVSKGLLHAGKDVVRKEVVRRPVTNVAKNIVTKGGRPIPNPVRSGNSLLRGSVDAAGKPVGQTTQQLKFWRTPENQAILSKLNQAASKPLPNPLRPVQSFADDFTGNLVKKFPPSVQNVVKGIVNPSTVKNPLGSVAADITKWTGLGTGMDALRNFDPNTWELPEDVQWNADGTGFEKMVDGNWTPVDAREQSAIYQNELSAHIANQGRQDGSIPSETPAPTPQTPAPTPQTPAPTPQTPAPQTPAPTPQTPPPVSVPKTPAVVQPTVPGNTISPKLPVKQEPTPAATPISNPSSSGGGFGQYMPLFALGGLGLGAAGLLASQGRSKKKKKKTPVDAYGRPYYR
jgi:hypothetical protein